MVTITVMSKRIFLGLSTAHIVAATALVGLTYGCGGNTQETDSDSSITTATTTTSPETTTEGPSTTTPTTTNPVSETDTTDSTSDSETTDDPTEDPTQTTTEDPTDTTTQTTSDTTPTTTEPTTETGVEECEAPIINLVPCDGDIDGSDPNHAFAAIGVGCEGDPDEVIPISNRKFAQQQQYKNSQSWRVATQFGTADDPNNPGEKLFRAREGSRFLVVSTGRIAAPDNDGIIVETPGSQFDNDNNLNFDTDSLPPPLSPELGSNNGLGGSPYEDCDGVNDCSDSIKQNWELGMGAPRDMLHLVFDVDVPAGTNGFRFDAAFFSSEFPEFVSDPFNDMFIVWTVSEVFTGNVAEFQGQPITVTSMAEPIQMAGYMEDDAELAGTGFEGYGSTGWFTVQAGAAPGETLTFAMAIMDMHDSNKASLAIMDNWRWSCEGCQYYEVNPNCGENDQPPCCDLCIESLVDPDCSTDGHLPCCLE